MQQEKSNEKQEPLSGTSGVNEQEESFPNRSIHIPIILVEKMKLF